MMSTGASIARFTEQDLEAARMDYVVALGRPTKFSPKLAAEICARLEKGESLKGICKDDHVPARETVNDWMRHNGIFGRMVARARQCQAHALADDALDLVDSAVNDPSANLTSIRASEIAAKMRMELAKCYDRDTFGDKSKVDISGRIEHSVGGILDAVISSGTSSLVIDAEEIPLSLIEHVQEPQESMDSLMQPQELSIF
jgi:hypothetical protein